jgi:hypothetical protein
MDTPLSSSCSVRITLPHFDAVFFYAPLNIQLGTSAEGSLLNFGSKQLLQAVWVLLLIFPHRGQSHDCEGSSYLRSIVVLVWRRHSNKAGHFSPYSSLCIYVRYRTKWPRAQLGQFLADVESLCSREPSHVLLVPLAKAVHRSWPGILSSKIKAGILRPRPLYAESFSIRGDDG